MRASGEVEQEARAELSRKKAELLRVQQELNRKLKQADKQRSKRKKLNQSVLNESVDKGSVVVQKNVMQKCVFIYLCVAVNRTFYCYNYCFNLSFLSLFLSTRFIFSGKSKAARRTQPTLLHSIIHQTYM